MSDVIAAVHDETGGKYYETKLEVELSDGRLVSVKLWSADPEPSSWELERWESREEFNRENCDSHYERDATRIVADAILALGSGGKT